MLFQSPYTLPTNGWMIQRSSVFRSGVLSCVVILGSACGSTNPIDTRDGASTTPNVSTGDQSQNPATPANPIDPVKATVVTQNPDSTPNVPERSELVEPFELGTALPEISINPGIDTGSNTGNVIPAAAEMPDAPDRVDSPDGSAAPSVSRVPAAIVAETSTPATCLAEPGHLQERALELINQARATPRSCGDVSYVAAPALHWNTTLEDVARAHSADMASINFFDHTGSDGSSAATRVTEAGYIWRTVGENIAAGRNDAALTINAWLESPGHCRNIMNPAFREVAVACVEDKGSMYRQYWTNVLAAPR